MPASEARLRANRKYDKENTRQIMLKLNKGTDKDILEKLDSAENRQGYIKALIREDIRKEGKKMRKEDSEYVKKYMAFMYHRENHFLCDECPENRGFDNWQGRQPCGQWGCWVDAHCDGKEEAESV